MGRTFIKNLKEISMKDFDAVGGKNSSLGEMLSNLTELGINVPGGFAITSSAFDEFMSSSCLLYTSPSPRDLLGSRMPSSA